MSNDKNWIDIIGYDGSYQIAIDGSVRSVDRLISHGIGDKQRLIKGRPRKISLTGNGYPFVGLRKNKKSRSEMIHRLIAIHFIPNLENKSQVNHIDGNKANHDVNNLEWCTPSENAIHAVNNNLTKVRGCSNYQSKMTDEKVRELIREYNNGGVTFYDLGMKYGIAYQTAHDIYKRKTWKHVTKEEV